jgi:tRNA(Arg) A34 adenosine deaminase TadA
VVYGASIEDAQRAGFNEIRLSARELKKLSGNQLELVPGFMQEECRKVFRAWARVGKSRPY